MPKDWLISPPWPDRDALAAALDVSPIVAQLLHNRGLDDPEAARSFLHPRMADIYPPEAMSGTMDAADRIVDAVRRGRRIVVFGDYDVDGITGVAILWHCLRLADAEVDFYVPHRLEEGYGISPDAIESLANDGAQLIVTVDCGVTGIEPAALARKLGVELIITDHHNPHTNESGEVQLPEAPIVHPGIAPDGETPYPNPGLSGAGAPTTSSRCSATSSGIFFPPGADHREASTYKPRPSFRSAKSRAARNAPLNSLGTISVIAAAARAPSPAAR